VVIPVDELIDEIFPEAIDGDINTSSIEQLTEYAKKFDLEELQVS
jgi:hypothetical protein